MTSIGDINHVLTQNSATSGVGDFGTGDYYVCYSVTNGIAKYRKHNDTSTNHDIKYDPSTGWSDAGGQEPDRFCTSATNNTIITPPVTATTLYMWTGTQFNLGLDTGYVASGSGTGTSGSTTPSGTVVKIGTSPNAATVKFTIDSSSPSSSGVISYEIVRDGVVQATITGHTAGAPTETIVGWYNSRWELRMVSTTGLYETQTLAFIVKEGKVHSNFW